MTPRDVLRLSIPPRQQFAWSIALAILTNVSAVALLATSMWLIVRAAERPPILFLSFAVVGVRAFALGRAFFRYVERLASHNAVFAQLPALRVRLFNRLADLAPWGIANVRRGDTLSRFVRDVDELQFYPLRVVLPSIASLAVLAATAIAVGLVEPLAGLATAAVLGIGVCAAAWVTHQSAKRSAIEIAPARGVLADAVLDAVSNWDVLVAYGANEAAVNSVRAAGESLSVRERHVATRNGIATGILILASALSIVAVAVAVTPHVVDDSLTVPAAAVLVLLPIALADVLGAIPLAVHARSAAAGAARRIAEMLPEFAPVGIADEPAEAKLPEVVVSAHPTLGFVGLSAQYPDTDTPALVDVTAHIASGELVLLTGASGAGKSTLAQVAVRLLDYRGSASLDGVELRRIGAERVRSHVVLCEQLPWLFHSSIRGNLQFAKPGASDDELNAVINRVGLSDWMRERGGLDAAVGERGELVSGGQAQRIALARALLSTAPIIVCDEPTANVDPSVADRLLRDIAALTPERSVLLISHQELPEGVIGRTVRIESGHLR